MTSGSGKIYDKKNMQLANAERIPLFFRRAFQSGFDPRMSLRSISLKNMSMLLRYQAADYQLSEAELIKLKEFLELHSKIEEDLHLGHISGADEVLNLLARLIGQSGQIAQLHSKDKLALLALIQFVSVVPRQNEYYNNDKIDKTTSDGYQYIKFLNHRKEEVIMQRLSYVKGQIIEEAINSKIVKFESISVQLRILLYSFIVLYFVVKLILVVFLSVDPSANSGFDNMTRSTD